VPEVCLLTINSQLSASENAEGPRPALVDIRYGDVGLVQVRVRTVDAGVLLDELTGRIAAAPHFFRRTAVCLDLSALETLPEIAEVRGVVEALRRAGMLAIGLSGDAAALTPASLALNLPILSSFRTPGRPVPVVQPPTSAAAASESEPPAPAEATAQAPAALLHLQPVRSGQRLYARDRDLIIVAGVGPGAEVMADGCVHIYGTLRGRAMAGAHGQSAARVFCQEFYAELVSIAGVFRVFETLPSELAGRPVQAWLEGEALHLARIG
jgi:septum site-determining protein MinC